VGAVGATSSRFGGVVTVRTLLSAALPKPSRAMTLNSCVDDGKRWNAVKNVYASRWTQYHQFVELSVEASHASEMLVSVLDVINRFVGVVGACLSPRGAA
jgi:hypothetical protein